MALILFFGAIGDVAGPSLETPVTDAIATVRDLRAWLGARDAHLGEALERVGVRVAVDQVFAGDHTSISDASEIAFMSPLSGG
jgi:sulfur-carrier protein